MVVYSKLENWLGKRVCHIEGRCRLNPINNSFGFSRSLLALGTLLTISVNAPKSIFLSESFSASREHLVQKLNLFFIIGYSNIYYAQFISIIVLLTVIIGIYPRITSILHWWVSFSFFNAAIIVDGGDQITQVLTLFFIPLCLLDGRKNHWGHPRDSSKIYTKYLSYLFLLLVKVQICILYFNSAVAKFNVEEWVDGTAMYYWLTNNTFGAPSYLINLLLPLVENAFIVWFLTWGTIVFELLLSFSLFFKPSHKILMLKLGLLFHFFIFILLGLGSFFFAMAGCLVVYLVSKPLPLNIIIWNPKQYIARYRGLIKNGLTR